MNIIRCRLPFFKHKPANAGIWDVALQTYVSHCIHCRHIIYQMKDWTDDL